MPGSSNLHTSVQKGARLSDKKLQLPGILMASGAIALLVLAFTGSTPAKPWAQGYDPLGHWWLSTICAALPVLVLLGTLALFRMKAHYAAVLALVTAIV